MLLILIALHSVFGFSARTAEVVGKDFSIIWGFDFINEDEIILTEKKGTMWKYHLKTKKREAIQNVPKVNDDGQGGLLDVKLHPNFKNNQWLYFSYSHFEGDEGGTRILRATLVENKLKEIKTIYVAKPLYDNSLHFGSRIAFDHKGHVFFTIGERYSERDKAQTLDNSYGKIMRVTENGDIPKDNPFVGKPNHDPAIWSYGHRNPQGLYFDKETKTLWAGEHGPRGGDEINIIEKGKNYGWPVVTHGREYSGLRISKDKSKPGIEDAIYVYVPSIAPSSLHVYKGNLYPELKDKIIQGALALQHINVVEVKDKIFVKEDRLFTNKYGRIRNLAESPSGKLYFSTDSGELYVLK